MVKFIKALVFGYRLKRQIRIADKRKAATGKKQFVLCICGRPMCVSKAHIRRLIGEGVYRKGITVSDIAAKAIYKTR